MATGDINDIVRRMRGLLPDNWFPRPVSSGQAESSPILAAILCGMASPLSSAYALLQYALSSTRLSTASDITLDIAADDLFGPSNFPRASGESDSSYLARIKIQVFAPRNTRTAITNALQAEPLQNSLLIESYNAVDCGVYGPNQPVAVGYNQLRLRYSGAPGQVFYEGTGASDAQKNICAIIEKNKAAGVMFWVRIVDEDAINDDFGGDLLY